MNEEFVNKVLKDLMTVLSPYIWTVRGREKLQITFDPCRKKVVASVLKDKKIKEIKYS